MQLRFDWWRWLVTTLVGFFILLMMYGCKTTRYVPVETIVKDTTSYAHWDSIVNERVKVIRDSLLSFHWEQSEKSVKDSTYIKDDVKTRVDDKGNVLGRDSTHIEIRYKDSKELSKVRDSLSHYKELSDSVGYFKAQVDSLSKKLMASKKKVEYIEKDLKGWDLFYYKVGMVVSWLVVISLVTTLIFWILKRKSFHVSNKF